MFYAREMITQNPEALRFRRMAAFRKEMAAKYKPAGNPFMLGLTMGLKMLEMVREVESFRAMSRISNIPPEHLFQKGGIIEGLTKKEMGPVQ